MVMRARHTRRSDPTLAGPTIQTAVRVPEIQRQAAQEAIDAGIPEIHSFTDVVVDALWLWLYETRKRDVSQPLPEYPIAPQQVLSETPRPDSNGRPTWKDVDPAALEES